MPHRLFIGIRPPEEIRDLLVDAMEGIEGARWVEEENLHLTLRFVGEVERPAANELALQVARVSGEAFSLRIEGVGHFTRKGQTTALWARVPDSAPLEALRQKVERACEAAGLGRETRRFTPHVTLARLNRSVGPIQTWLASFGDMRAGWTVAEFILFESYLGHTGVHYEVVAQYPLAG
jgi:RNA 2',3'-cyclic 3'-phosphodiesterase